MGRKKKDDAISYSQIVSSTYVRKNEYEKAQIAFSSALDDYGNLRTSSGFSFLDIEQENTWGDEDVFD
jgi:hypothetical protein